MKTVRLLTGGEFAPERSLDLHGRTRLETSRLVRQFVRDAHRAGRRTLAIVHGRGTHSAIGGVLREAVIEALTKGGAAPLVHAFATAPPRLGGEGALLVRLAS
jgi:DNA-nicking Smr family endonuclease